MLAKKHESQTSPLSTAAQYILLVLAGRDLHGYGIIQEVARLSEGSYGLGPGTLYDNLKKLINAGLVTDAPRTASSTEERRFYRITNDGRKVLAAEIARLQSLVDAHSSLTRPRNA